MTLSSMSDTLGRRHRRLALFRKLLLLAYVVLFLLVFLFQAEDPIFVWMTLGPTALALWFGPFDILASDIERKWYDPALLFNMAIFYYAIKGMTLAGGNSPTYLWDIPYDVIAQHYIFVTLCVMGGLVAWNWGYHAVLRSKTPKSLAAQFFPKNNAESVRLSGNPTLGVMLLSLVGIGSFFMFTRSIGGNILFLILNPLQRSYLTDPAYGIASPLVYLWDLGIDMFPVASLIWLAAIGQMKKRPNILWWLHVSISVGVNLAIGGRLDVVGLVLAVAMVYHLLVSPLSRVHLAGLGLVSVTYSYFINLWRSAMGGMSSASLIAGQAEVASRLSMDGLLSFLGGTDLTDIRFFVLIADACGRVLPFQYGGTLLRIVSQYVPRALWPGKPLDLSVVLAQLYEPGATAGTPPGFFAEMYLNLHIFGVILGGVLLGAGLALLYRNWIVTKQVRGVVFYAILLPRIMVLPSATFANMVGSVGVSVLGAMVAFSISKLFSRGDRMIGRSDPIY